MHSERFRVDAGQSDEGGSFDQRRAGPAGLHTFYFRGGVVEAARTRGFRRNGDDDAGRRVCADVQRSGTLASNRDGPCNHTSPDETVILGEYDTRWRAGAAGDEMGRALQREGGCLYW